MDLKDESYLEGNEYHGGRLQHKETFIYLFVMLGSLWQNKDAAIDISVCSAKSVAKYIVPIKVPSQMKARYLLLMDVRLVCC